MKWPWQLWAAGAVVAIVVGVTMGFLVNLQPATEQGPNTLSLNEVIVGIPETLPAAGKPWDATSRLMQKRTYATDDPLAVRVVSRASTDQQFPLTARLLKDDGSLHPLSPATVTVSGGTSGYCCWTIPEAGKYKLQIFAGQQAPFVLPVTIVAARKNASPIKIQ